MYEESTRLYDFIHDFKQYKTEADEVHRLIQAHQHIESLTLLDVGCGTGKHLRHLHDRYQVAGLDLNPDLLAVAREHLPDVTFYEDDMRHFSLNRQFDVITCMFGAIAYVRTPDALTATLRNFVRHLKPGGVLVLEPFLQPDDYEQGKVFSLFRDEPHLKVARLSNSTRHATHMTAHFHYLVGSAEGIRYFTETHHLGLVSRENLLDTLNIAWFVDVQTPEIEVFKRGIYVATRSSSDAH